MNIWMYYRDFAVLGDVDTGGITKAVTGLAGAMAAHSARVTVLCEAAQSTVPATSHGFELRAFRHNPRSRLRISADLRSFIADSAPPDLVVLNGIFTANVAQVARALRRRAIPYVHAPHDPYSPAIFARKRYFKVPYWWLMERPLIAGARAVQVLDEKQGQWLRTRGLGVPVITVPNGVFVDDVAEEKPWQLRGEGSVRVLFLGRLDAFNKGLDLLIDAAAPLRDRIELTIQGPDVGDAQKLASQAADRRLSVKFLPPDYTTVPSQLIARYDVLCCRPGSTDSASRLSKRWWPDGFFSSARRPASLPTFAPAGAGSSSRRQSPRSETASRNS